jgi:hypothetical protein
MIEMNSMTKNYQEHRAVDVLNNDDILFSIGIYINKGLYLEGNLNDKFGGEHMTQDEYIESLQRKFEKNFNIEKDMSLFGERVDVHAKFYDISGRTFITKNDIIDRCENYEYCYIKKVDMVTEKEVASYGQLLRKIVDECIDPGKDHMSTYVTGVIICNGINEYAKQTIKTYCYSKVYSFYLRGWCDVRLLCVNSSNNEIVTNKAGKRVQKVYQLTP